MNNNSFRLCGGLVLAALAVASTAALAVDPIEITGSSPMGHFQESAKSLPSLVSDLIKGSGRFGNLQNEPFTADLRYYNQQQALHFDVTQPQPNEWRAVLTTPFKPGLVDRTFIAPSRDALNTQIEDYLKKEGTTDLASWLKSLSQGTPFGVSAGNPNSTTALQASSTYDEYGFAPVQTGAEMEEPEDQAGAMGFAVMGDVGFIRAQGYTAKTYSVCPFIPFRLSSRVRLDVGVPLNYTEVEGAQTFRAGLQLGVPILLKKRNMKEGQRLLWQLAPSGSISAAGTADMVDGGLIAGAGLTSQLGYNFGPVEVSMGNQFNLFQSLPISLGDYKYDPRLSSQILKNGLKIGVPIGRHWYVEAYGIDTELLGDGKYMSRYTTLGGGVGYRTNTKKRGYLMVGGYTHIGTGWSQTSFQFGTGWKF
jgi:hypothetical protein